MLRVPAARQTTSSQTNPGSVGQVFCRMSLPDSHAPSSTTLPADHFVVGTIQRAHGTRGEVKVHVLSDNANRFQPEHQMTVSRAPGRLTVQHARPHKASLLVQFTEITTRTEAEKLRGAWLTVAATEVPELDPGSYWVHDILGCQVTTLNGQVLGCIQQVLATGANDVYEVAPDKSLDRTAPILLPATSDVIRMVDTERRHVVVHLLPGLVEDLP